MPKAENLNLYTLTDCWLQGYATCTGEIRRCDVHLSVAQWIRLCAGSGFNPVSMEHIANCGSAFIYAFKDCQQREGVFFHIYWDWKADEILIIARE